MKTAEIIIIGNEITSGKTKDTNSNFLSIMLHSIDIEVKRITTIKDELKDIISIIKNNDANADMRFISGGLVPTHDDITKYALCQVFDSKLIMNNEVEEHLIALFKRRNRTLSDTNRRQALVPDKAQIIFNEVGTASCLLFEKNKQLTFALPGVPFEFEWLVSNKIIPYLNEKINANDKIYSSDYTFIGIGESYLFDAIQSDTSVFENNCEVAFLPSPGLVKVRITHSNHIMNTADNDLFAKIDAEFKHIFSDVYLGRDTPSLSKLIHDMCVNNNITLSLAESCTGGYISHLFTSNHGSSAFFKGSIIAYSNEIKSKMLDVDESTIEKHGAVSEQAVKGMAVGAIKHFKTDYILSISGIAGPEGGTSEKPIGTVWVCVGNKNETKTQLFQLGGSLRTNIIERAAISALFFLYKFIRDTL